MNKLLIFIAFITTQKAFCASSSSQYPWINPKPSPGKIFYKQYYSGGYEGIAAMLSEKKDRSEPFLNDLNKVFPDPMDSERKICLVWVAHTALKYEEDQMFEAATSTLINDKNTTEDSYYFSVIKGTPKSIIEQKKEKITAVLSRFPKEN